MRLLSRILLAFGAACLLVAAACDDDDDELAITVRAEVVEDDAPVSVEATAVQRTDDGPFAHAVRVTWRGDEMRILDDARFTHHVIVESGDLITAGRGCGANWDEAEDRLVQACTADLLLVDLEPGETHDYPVHIYPRIGPLRLEAGTYVVEEVISWWPVENAGATPEGQFSVRLTYEVE